MPYLTPEQRKADLAVLHGSPATPVEVYSWICSLAGLAGISRTGSRVCEFLPGARYISKLYHCCGIVNVDSWMTKKLDPFTESVFRILIDELSRCHSGMSGMKAGAVITTTNAGLKDIETFLSANGFVGKTFYNASSENEMTLWTLILHPERRNA